MTPLLLLLLQLSADHEAALSAYRQHQYPEAAARFESALQSEKPGTPEYGESVLLLGQTLFLQGKYADSIPWLEKATAGVAPPAEASYMLGNANILTQQPEKAVKAFAKLFGLPPESAGARLTTARMMLQRDLDADAAKQAKSALQTDPHIPEAHFLLGEIAIAHGQIDEAVVELNQEIAINPGYAMAHYRLGDAYSRREDWDHAIAPLERSVWLNPNYSAPFILLGKGYLKQKKFADAEGVLRHALRLDPQNLSAHYLLGQTYMQQGKSEEAKKEMDKWRELNSAK